MTHPLQAVIDTVRAGGMARLCWLVFAQFGDGDVRIWPGIGMMTTGGFDWMGANGKIEIPDMTLAAGFIATRIDIRLSGVTREFQTRVEGVKDLVSRRPISIFLQGIGEDWQPIGSPIAVWAGLMDIMKYSGKIDTSEIVLSCETPFVTRSTPRASYYTDADQKLRSPGDRGCEFVAALENKNVDQPVLPG